MCGTILSLALQIINSRQKHLHIINNSTSFFFENSSTFLQLSTSDSTFLVQLELCIFYHLLIQYAWK